MVGDHAWQCGREENLVLVVELDVNITDVDIDVLHAWLDSHAPGWSVQSLRVSGSSLAYSGPSTPASVKWMKIQFDMFRRLSNDQGVWIRYGLPTEASALLARLTWETRAV